MSSAEIKEQALALSPEERVDLAESLWESLESYPYPVSEEFLAELHRRDREMSEGKGTYSTAEEVLARLKKML